MSLDNPLNPFQHNGCTATRRLLQPEGGGGATRTTGCRSNAKLTLVWYRQLVCSNEITDNDTQQPPGGTIQFEGVANDISTILLGRS